MLRPPQPHTPPPRSYIKYFFIHMPIASPLGWLAHKLPDAVHVANLSVMWLVEIPLPFLLFAAGTPRLIAALGYIGLMFGIHITGNFGYFNILTAVLTLPQLAYGGSLLQASWGPSGPVGAILEAVTHIVSIPAQIWSESVDIAADFAHFVGLGAVFDAAAAVASQRWAYLLSQAAALVPWAATWGTVAAPAQWGFYMLSRVCIEAPMSMAWWALLFTGASMRQAATIVWKAAGSPATAAVCSAVVNSDFAPTCTAHAESFGTWVADSIKVAVLGVGTHAAVGGGLDPAAAATGAVNNLTDTLPHTLLLLFALCIVLPLSLLNLPFNSWIAVGWPYWPTLLKAQPQALVQGMLAYVRTLLPFRLVHSYGVFPPHSAPDVRWVIVYEGSSDGEEWRQWEWPCTVTHEYSPPRFIAPYMPRKDHDLFYESNGMGNGHNFMKLFGTGNPYRHTRSTPWHRIQARLLEGVITPKGQRNATYDIFANNPFPDPTSPPKYVRCSLYMYEPASMQQWTEEGRWWNVTHAGYNLPACTLEQARHTWSEWLSPPEAWWGEAVIWKRRAQLTAGGITIEEYEEAWAFIDAVRKAAAKRADAVAIERGQQGGLSDGSLAESAIPDSPQDAVDPRVARELFTWEQVHEVTRAVRRPRSAAALRRVELTIGRMLAPLQARLEALYLRPTPTPDQLQAELDAEAAAAAHMPGHVCHPDEDEFWAAPSASSKRTPRGSAKTTKATRKGEAATENVSGRVARMDPVQAALAGSVTSQAMAADCAAAATHAWRLLSAADPLPSCDLGVPAQQCEVPDKGPVPSYVDIYACLHGMIEQPVVGQAPRGGYFSTPFKIASYAQWYLLVGGQDLYERAVGGQDSVVGGHRLPLVWPPPASAAPHWRAEADFQAAGGKQADAPLPYLSRATWKPLWNASNGTSENMLYLMSVLHYDTLAMQACKGRLNWALKRHEEEAVGERPGSLTPGFIDLLPDVRECGNLRLWDPVAASWTPTWIVPRWQQGRQDGEWVMISNGISEAGRLPEGYDVLLPWGKREEAWKSKEE